MKFIVYDKNKKEIKQGDLVKVTTIASLNGVFPVVVGKDGELYFHVVYEYENEEKSEHLELVYGFYSSSLDVVEGSGRE